MKNRWQSCLATFLMSVAWGASAAGQEYEYVVYREIREDGTWVGKSEDSTHQSARDAILRVLKINEQAGVRGTAERRERLTSIAATKWTIKFPRGVAVYWFDPNGKARLRPPNSEFVWNGTWQQSGPHVAFDFPEHQKNAPQGIVVQSFKFNGRIRSDRIEGETQDYGRYAQEGTRSMTLTKAATDGG